MAIFPNLELEALVQENDKTRLDARKSFVTPDEANITLVEIEPESGAGFIDVTSGKFLDYQFATAGTQTVTVRVTTDGAPVTSTKDIEVVDATTDALFSSDAELTAHEPDILKYVRAGRNSYLDVHRSAQDRIITWLDEHRIWDGDGARLTKDAILDVEEVNDWSKYLTLRLIFEGLSNDVNDVFSSKARGYARMEEEARNRTAIRLDRDGDGTADVSEFSELRSARLVRR
jgi:hypothetical protein